MLNIRGKALPNTCDLTIRPFKVSEYGTALGKQCEERSGMKQ